jgi:Fe-S-cluster containining protein
MLNLKQFVPSDFCLECFGCCRFAQNPAIWAPAGCNLVKNNGEYVCENLKEDNRCRIYAQRPLDCRLYPFLLVRRGNSLQLGIHRVCGFIQEKNLSNREIQGYADYLKERLRTDDFFSILENNPQIAADYTEDVETLAELVRRQSRRYQSGLGRSSDPIVAMPTFKIGSWHSDRTQVSVGNVGTHREKKPRDLSTGESSLLPLTPNDKSLIEGFFQRNQSVLSNHHFAGIFIWRDLFDIFWTVIGDALCIFYQDKIGMFMPLPPQGELNEDVVKKCFEIMGFYNQNSAVSRIENVSEGEAMRYVGRGFKLKPKDTEYLCLREKLVNLSGDAFKHKRASYNHFEKNYKAEILEYNVSFYEDCLALYGLWLKMRKDRFPDYLYQQMLEDSFISFKSALKFYKELDLVGYVVKIGKEIKACSLGYGLNKETFCVLFEVCDLSIKGIAQFIFRELCRRLDGYKCINIMGASDLENLKNVKLSYRPFKEVKVYNIYQ